MSLMINKFDEKYNIKYIFMDVKAQYHSLI